MKENSELFTRNFHENIKPISIFRISEFQNSVLLSGLEVAYLTPAFEKKSKTSKDSYRPIRTTDPLEFCL